MKIFVIDLAPIALKRHRVTTRGGRIKCYDMQVEEKRQFASEVRSQLDKNTVLPLYVPEISLRVEFEFYCQMTQKRLQSPEKYENTYVFTKPDLSNYIKFIEDALSKVIWYDDNQIVEIAAKKVYSEYPKVIVKVGEADGGRTTQKNMFKM